MTGYWRLLCYTGWRAFISGCIPARSICLWSYFTASWLLFCPVKTKYSI